MSFSQAILEWLANLVIGFIDSSGQVGVFILMAAESANILIPSEIIMPFSGFLASVGRFNFWAVVVVGALGNLAGSLVSYWIGAKGGRPFLEKYGKYVLINKKDFERGDRAFKKYGLKIIFWGRLVPIVRTFVSLPAGISRVSLGGFTLYTLAGSLIWSWVLVFIGFKLGENWQLAGPLLERFSTFIAGLIILGIVLYIWHHIKDGIRKQEAGSKTHNS